MVLVWLCWVFTNLSAIFEKRIMRIGKGISVKIFAIQVQVSITRWVIVECLMCRNILISCKESLHLWDFRWSGHTMMNGDSLWVGELEFGNNFAASTFFFNFFFAMHPMVAKLWCHYVTFLEIISCSVYSTMQLYYSTVSFDSTKPQTELVKVGCTGSFVFRTVKQ